jgi:hypothetical protein
MVVEAGTCSATGTYTANSGFTKAQELAPTGADGMDGYKSATGADETPSVTHTATTERQTLIGFVVNAPLKATVPNPANTATEVSPSLELDWTAGAGATSRDVYFGTSSPGTFRGNQTSTTYDSGTTLSPATTYYWRIDEINAGGTTTGDVWSFTTVALPWSDNFESQNLTAGGWTVAGTAAAFDGAGYPSGWGARIPGSSLSRSITKSKSTEGYDTIHVKYDRKLTSTTAAQITLAVQWSADGGSNWILLETVSGTDANTWASRDYTLTTAADNNPDFRVRFITTAGTTSYYAYIDNVQITGDSTALPFSTLTSSSNDGGNVTTPGEGTSTYDNGTVLSLVATADAGYTFVNWTEDTGDTGSIADVNASVTTITMDANYVIQANFAPVLPGKATNLSPAHLASNVGVNADLSWTADAGATSHDVYFGTNLLPGVGEFKGNQAGTTYDPGTLNGNTTYYWRIDEKNAGGTTTGDVWSFTTVAAIEQRSLTVSSSAGGTVTQPGIGPFQYNHGTVVDLNAVPNVGYHFVNWTGDTGTIADVNAPVTTITMNADYTIQANFAVNQYTISGNTGVGDVNLEGLGVVSGGDGNYTKTVDYGWDGTVTPTKAGYTFTPASTVYIDVAENHTDNYTATLNTYTISGNTGVSGATMNGLPNTPVSEADGNYSDTVNHGWSGMVTPAKEGYTFSPASKDYSNVTSDQLNQDYAATLNTYTISGNILEPDGNIPVEGVLVDANNNGGSTDTTDANGYYEVVVPYNWSGTATPIKEGYTFEPNSILYNNVVADEVNDYTATLSTFVISGYITESEGNAPINDVNVSAENGGGPYTSRYGGGQDTTDVNGYYEVLVDYNWSGNVVPSKYAYAFEPNSRYYADVNEDTADQDYIGTLLTYRITGYIKNECNVPIEDVVVNGGGQGTTDVNGFYEVWVDYNWSGTVTPSKAHYTFEPNQMSYVDVLAGQQDQNYVAHNIYDLDYDCYIGWGDVAVIHDNWLETGENIPGDFYKDEANTVNFLDFADFANVWKD